MLGYGCTNEEGVEEKQEETEKMSKVPGGVYTHGEGTEGGSLPSKQGNPMDVRQ